MKRSLNAIAAATILTALTWTAIPSPSWGEALNAARPVGFCVKVTATIGPHHSHVGDPISFSASWQNCGQSIYFREILIAKGPCGPLGRVIDDHVRLRPGEGVAVGFPTFNACRGTYRVTAKAYRQGVLLDRMSRYLRITP